jgi:hypothetical protein
MGTIVFCVLSPPHPIDFPPFGLEMPQHTLKFLNKTPLVGNDMGGFGAKVR